MTKAQLKKLEEKSLSLFQKRQVLIDELNDEMDALFGLMPEKKKELIRRVIECQSITDLEGIESEFEAFKTPKFHYFRMTFEAQARHQRALLLFK